MLFTLLVGSILIPVAVLAWPTLWDQARRLHPPRRMQRLVDAVGWLVPGLLVLAVVVLYPVVSTVIGSFFDASGSNFVGWANYQWVLTSGALRDVLRATVTWVIVFTILTTLVGLVVAIASDRVKYERLVKTIVLMPTAISMTATGVIWQLVYQYQPAVHEQTGTLSAITSRIPWIGSQAWLQNPNLSTYALIVAAIWAQTGIATVILSAAVKNMPAEVIEAAKVDGASAWRTLRSVMLPLLWPTIVVVLTLEVIYALKVFDIVYVMTGGNYGTDVLASQVYTQLFLSNDLGRASALSMVLLILVLPVVAYNVKQAKS